MKKKGFTLVELLVVIAIIALLMGILMPALARVRALAQRVVCGTHLSSSHKAMLLYANENDHKYVRSGGRESKWGATILKWNATPQEGEIGAFGDPANPPPPNNTNRATIGSNFYYLIKYADSTPKIFLCGGDTGVNEFKTSDYRDATGKSLVYNSDLTMAWDFGPTPQKHYSYAYQCPFGQIGGLGFFPLTALSDPGMAIMADKSPYLALQADLTWDVYVWRNLPNASKDTEKWGNSPNHKGEGQNVLFNDGHVTFSEIPYCGVDDDNIYSKATPDRPVEVGKEPWDPYQTDVVPQSKIDSVLINDGVKQGGIALSGPPPMD